MPLSDREWRNSNLKTDNFGNVIAFLLKLPQRGRMFIENEIKILCSTPAGVECWSFITYFYKHTNPPGLR